MKVCPECGDSKSRLGQHFALSSCNYPEIDDQSMEILTGALMGDGTIVKGSKRYQMNIGSTTIEYLQYLLEVLPDWLTNEIYLDTPSSKRPNPSTHKDYYGLSLMRHPTFNKMRDTWYDNGKKRFPDLTLTPTILRHWYVTDGTFDDRSDAIMPRAGLCSVNESDRPEFIEQLFTDVGLSVTYDMDGKFRVNAADIVDFFDFIGWTAIPGFEYKWPDRKI